MGIDPATGKEVFLTKEGRYTFQYNADDEVKVGSTAPDLEGVIGMTFYWKQLSASINCRYQFGAQTFASALYNKVENLSEQQLAETGRQCEVQSHRQPRHDTDVLQVRP